MGRMKLGPPTLLVACVAYRPTFHGLSKPFAHLDAWILLPPGGSFQYGFQETSRDSKTLRAGFPRCSLLGRKSWELYVMSSFAVTSGVDPAQGSSGSSRSLAKCRSGTCL